MGYTTVWKTDEEWQNRSTGIAVSKQGRNCDIQQRVSHVQPHPTTKFYWAAYTLIKYQVIQLSHTHTEMIHCEDITNTGQKVSCHNPCLACILLFLHFALLLFSTIHSHIHLIAILFTINKIIYTPQLSCASAGKERYLEIGTVTRGITRSGRDLRPIL